MRTETKRVTIYFEPDIHRALRLKAAATERSVSDMVNEAVKLALAEDVEDIQAFEERVSEPNLDFDQFRENVETPWPNIKSSSSRRRLKR